MKIIDILKDSAQLLGLVGEVSILQDTTEENESQTLQDNHYIESLFNLCKFSIRELCTNYVPVAMSVEITSNEQKFPVSQLENFIRVHNIYQNEEMVKYKIINRNILFEKDGDYVVNYATYPSICSMFDEVDFLQNLSPDVMVFGLCAYFSLAHGMFNEFKDFHEKYISKAESLKDLRIFEMPNRRWLWEKRKL